MRTCSEIAHITRRIHLVLKPLFDWIWDVIFWVGGIGMVKLVVDQKHHYHKNAKHDYPACYEACFHRFSESLGKYLGSFSLPFVY